MEIKIKFLVVGLGSMGKRRVRNLQALRHTALAGFDPRADRRKEASSRYGIATFDSFNVALATFKPDVLVISTGPSLHMEYAHQAAKLGLHCFIEASVVEGERIAELCKALEGTKLVMVPSCTMHYFPGPAAVREVVRSGKIGKPINLNYLTGQYLPDWHPWENIQDFYVSKRETGGAREIVPFELTWINEIFGQPEPLACVKDKLTDLDADIDDIYHCLLRYPNGLLANITIEVISRPRATREFHIIGSEGRLVFSGDENCVRYISVGNPEWTRIDLKAGTVEKGYINPEEPYISEMADFIKAIEAADRKVFPNTLESDVLVLSLLNNLEKLCVAQKNKKPAVEI
jgi:predicted dehydrogenase